MLELEQNSGTVSALRTQEQSARMLAHLIFSAPDLIRPSMASLLANLVHKIDQLFRAGASASLQPAAISGASALSAGAGAVVGALAVPVLPSARSPASSRHAALLMTLLVAVGHCACADGVEARQSLAQVLPVCIAFLRDSLSLHHRQIALWTLRTHFV